MRCGPRFERARKRQEVHGVIADPPALYAALRKRIWLDRIVGYLYLFVTVF
jgi:hypothetical protein